MQQTPDHQTIAGIVFYFRADTFSAFSPVMKIEAEFDDDEPWTWAFGYHTLVHGECDDAGMINEFGFATRREAKAARDKAIAEACKDANGSAGWIADCSEDTWRVLLALCGWADTRDTEF